MCTRKDQRDSMNNTFSNISKNDGRNAVVDVKQKLLQTTSYIQKLYNEAKRETKSSLCPKKLAKL